MRENKEKGDRAMSIRRLKHKAFLALCMCLLLLCVLGSATFAWFTANSQVETSRVTSRTATENVELLLSSAGGDAFAGAEESDIAQVNTADMLRLMPVSTADLQHFVTCTATTEEDYATYFVPVENEDDYFHGRIYLMAKVTGSDPAAEVSVYFDTDTAVGGVLVQKSDEDSLLLNAARMGLIWNDDPRTATIFRLSDEKNTDVERRNNTVLGGAVLEEGYVLDSSGSTVAAVTDPAVLLADFAVDENSDQIPAESLFTLEAGKIYPLDIYFYLEGCDADCTEAISFDAGDLHLAFYGVLN